jgi:hypothetical protein
VASANAAMSVVSAWTMLKNAWETIEDPDTSGWEKLLTVMTTMSMTIPSLTSGLNSLKTVFAGSGVADMAGAAGAKIGEKIPAKLKINNNKASLSKADAKRLAELTEKYNIEKNRDGSISFNDIHLNNKARKTEFKGSKLKDIAAAHDNNINGETANDLLDWNRLEGDRIAANRVNFLKSAASWGILAGVILASVVAI